MKYRRISLVVLALIVAIVGGIGLSWRAQWVRYARNRQLMAAVVKNDVPLALALLKAGADPNTRYTSAPAPTLPVLWRQLLHRTAVPETGPTALLISCGAGWVIGPGRTTPYAQPARPEAPELVEAMLRHGANVNAQDAYQLTPLAYAVQKKQIATTRLLLQYHADVNGAVGWTPLMFAVDQDTSPEIVRMLLDQGSAVNTRFKYGMTPLLQAVTNNASGDLVQLLLEHGADTAVRDPDGKTPLGIAVYFGNKELITLLRKAGAR